MVEKSFNKYIARILIFLLFAVSFIYYSFPNSISSITGFATGINEKQTFTDNINLLVNNSYNYTWQPNNNCDSENCKITSIKITGYALSNQTGSLKIILQSNDKRYLIINKSLELFGENLTVQQQSSFWDECVETCNINIVLENISINFEQNPNTILIINSITYTFDTIGNIEVGSAANKISENKTQQTLNDTLNSTQFKQTNISWFPVDEANLTLPIIAAAAYFAGGQFIVIPDSEKINLENNSIIIETSAKIGGDGYGVIVSKYDRENGKYFQILTEPDGIIAINYGDGSSSEFLESPAGYNDNNFHEI